MAIIVRDIQDKEILLKDLCSRLPYGVMVREDTVLYDDENTTSHRIKKLSYVQIGKAFSRIKGFMHDYEYIYIPYLFPLSSMTEEQKREQETHFTCIKHDMSFSICRYMEWCYKNHLDINGLIPKGLAIDATGLNIY